jgi:hypothetical protein
LTEVRAVFPETYFPESWTVVGTEPGPCAG